MARNGRGDVVVEFEVADWVEGVSVGGTVAVAVDGPRESWWSAFMWLMMRCCIAAGSFVAILVKGRVVLFTSVRSQNLWVYRVEIIYPTPR